MNDEPNETRIIEVADLTKELLKKWTIGYAHIPEDEQDIAAEKSIAFIVEFFSVLGLIASLIPQMVKVTKIHTEINTAVALSSSDKSIQINARKWKSRMKKEIENAMDIIEEVNSKGYPAGVNFEALDELWIDYARGLNDAIAGNVAVLRDVTKRHPDLEQSGIVPANKTGRKPHPTEVTLATGKRMQEIKDRDGYVDDYLPKVALDEVEAVLRRLMGMSEDSRDLNIKDQIEALQQEKGDYQYLLRLDADNRRKRVSARRGNWNQFQSNVRINVSRTKADI